jgi:hypothetical protein
MTAPVTVLVADFDGESTQVIESLGGECPAVALDGRDYVAEVNRLVGALLTDYVCLTNGGAVFTPGWAGPCATLLASGADLVSPYVDGHQYPERVSPYAVLTRRTSLERVGGLDERLKAFGWERLLCRSGLRTGHAAAAHVNTFVHGGRIKVLGALYYDQLADDEVVREVEDA